MENMYFLNKIMASNYFKKNGEKVYGNMYKLQDGRLIKEYNEQKIKGLSVNYSKDNLLDFKDIDIEGVSFIKALVYTGLHNIYATITEDVPGISINKTSLGSYQIDNLIEAIKKLETTIIKLSERGISATMDIYAGNIVYNGETITLIDTAEYYYKNESVSRICEDNMTQIMNEIFFNIFTVTGYKDIYYLKKYFEMRNSRYAEFNKIEFLLHPSESLTEMKKIIEEDYGIRINTFNECYQLITSDVEKKKIKRIQTINR